MSVLPPRPPRSEWQHCAGGLPSGGGQEPWPTGLRMTRREEVRALLRVPTTEGMRAWQVAATVMSSKRAMHRRQMKTKKCTST